MKLFTRLMCLSFALSSGSVFAQVNMSDNLDKNIVPAHLEEREQEEKARNLSDTVDRNTVPAPFEERQKEEEANFSDETKSGTGSGSGQSDSQKTNTSSPQSQDSM